MSIANELRSILPNLALGCIRARVEVEKHSPELWEEIELTIKRLSSSLSLETIGSIPEIRAVRDAYKLLRKDPMRYRGSAEALLRRILGGKSLYKINTLVDINNLISLKTLHPVGSYDYG